MSDGDGIFDVLGIPPTEDASAIRRAYALRLRENPPETDAHAFGRLRAAYEAALQRASRARAKQAPSEERVPAPPAPATADDPTSKTPSPEAPVSAPEAVAPDPLAAAHARDLEAAREAYNELEARLAGRLPSTPDELDGALHRLFTTAGTLRLSLWPEVEARTAALLARHTPTSDPLLAEAARRFGWRRNELDSHTPSGAVAALLTRLRALEVAATLREAGGEPARTLAMLMAPPPVGRVASLLYGLRHGPAVRRFVQGPIGAHRELVQLLSAPTLDWWREYGRRPRIGQQDLLFAGAVSTWAVALVVGAARFGGALPGQAASALPGLGAGLLGPLVVALWFGVVRWPRHWLLTREAASPSLLRQFGWVAVALGLPGIALATGADARATAGLAILGVATWIWASATAIREPPPGFRMSLRYALGLGVRHIGTLVWTVIAMLCADATMAVATAGAAGSAMIGAAPLAQGFQVRLSRRWRWAGLALISALCTTTLGVLWLSDAVDFPWSLAIALGAVVVVVSRTCWAPNPIGSEAVTRGAYYGILFVVSLVLQSARSLTASADGSVTALRTIETLLIAWVAYSIVRSGVETARR